MTDTDHAPIVHSLSVGCSPEHAFRTWTERIDTWWPRDHRLTGDPHATMRFEDPPDGRLVETATAGAEIEWGRIRQWDPPDRLRFDWAPGGRQDRATEVEVTFRPEAGGRTMVEVVHRGWERFTAEDLAAFKPLNKANWVSCLQAYEQAVADGAA